MKSSQSLAALMSLVVMLVGCSTDAGLAPVDSATASVTSTLGPGLTLVTATPKPVPRVRVQPPPADTPLCDIQIDLEQEVLPYSTTLQMRPPFYRGPMPLEFTSAKKLGMNAGLGSPTVVTMLGDWLTVFDYSDPSFEAAGIATCAQTLSESKRMLAEARLEDVIEGTGIIILEVHYGEDGRVRFWCRSQIDFGLGFKTREMDAHGSKEAEYYFMWPVLGY